MAPSPPVVLAFTMNTTKIIAAAKRARKFCGIANNERAVFNDCGPVSRQLVQELAEIGIDAQLAHGQFKCDDDTEFDHTWVVVDGVIIDPTVDQFFSDLEIDLVTHTPGLYFPPHDTDYLNGRYITH
jgi:hypothetical protein